MIANTMSAISKTRIEVLEVFLQAGKEVIVLSEKDGTEDILINKGCKLIEVKSDRRGTNPLHDIKLFFRYLMVLKKENPDAVLTYHIKPNIYAGIAARLLGIKYYPNITGLGTAVANQGLLQQLTLFLYRVALRRAACIFFQNQGNLDFFKSKEILENDARICLLPGSGVNLDDFVPMEYPSESEAIRLLFIGRIMKDKGINELLAAFKVVKEQYQDVELHIVGSFDEDYAEIINSYVESGLIEFHGHQKSVKPFIRKAHVIVLPSYHEGMSNALLEAAASARPLIASNVPGCKETFDDEITGFACEARDIDTLVEAMVRFISLPYKDKVEMGLKARKIIEKKFDRRLVVKAYMKEVLEEIYG